MWLGKCDTYRLEVAEINMHFLTMFLIGTATNTLSGCTGTRMESVVALRRVVSVGTQECEARLSGVTNARW